MLATNIVQSYGHLIQCSCPVLGFGGVPKNPYRKELICYKTLYKTSKFCGLVCTQKWNLQFQKSEFLLDKICIYWFLKN